MTDNRTDYINLAPTWAGVLPLLLAALTDGTDGARTMARAELARMARLADRSVAAARNTRPTATPNP